jgi:hypothetical protein
VSAPGGIRTHTGSVLSRLSLPVGVPGRIVQDATEGLICRRQCPTVLRQHHVRGRNDGARSLGRSTHRVRGSSGTPMALRCCSSTAPAIRASAGTRTTPSQPGSASCSSPHALAVALELGDRVTKVGLAAPIAPFDEKGTKGMVEDRDLKAIFKLAHVKWLARATGKMEAKHYRKDLHGSSSAMPTTFSIPRCRRGSRSDSLTPACAPGPVRSLRRVRAPALGGIPPQRSSDREVDQSLALIPSRFAITLFMIWSVPAPMRCRRASRQARLTGASSMYP